MSEEIEIIAKLDKYVAQLTTAKDYFIQTQQYEAAAIVRDKAFVLFKASDLLSKVPSTVEDGAIAGEIQALREENDRLRSMVEVAALIRP